MTRRKFIWAGLIFVPTYALAQVGLRSPAFVAQLQRPSAGGGRTNSNLKTIVSGNYVYDPVDNLPFPAGASINITGGAGWTTGVNNIIQAFENYDTGADGLKNLYELSISVGTHPLTGGTYTL